MELRTFLGGVHPAPSKGRTAASPIEAAPLPKRVVIPLVQGGAPCEPLVKQGDAVLAGQKIGESKAFVSAPVHASISGKVTAIETHLLPTGREALAVVIEGDESDTWVETKGHALDGLTVEDLKALIREAGLVGMGGAMFPAHVKVSPPPGKTFDSVIINGAECEPYLTCDQRLMTEEPEKIILGLRAWLKVTGAERGYIGIENNKPEAISALKAAAAGEGNVEVVPLLTKYPQGSEKQLIKAILGREVPSGGLPVDAGALVQNVGTTYALATAIESGRPLVERVVTVTGTPLKAPRNLKVRLGTLFSDLLAYCGLEGEVGKVISGGPMMGIALPTTDVPVIKGTSGILLLTPAEAEIPPERACIRCGRCVDACPIGLIPTFLDQFCRKEMWDRAEEYHVQDCIECGSCAYVCPSKRHLVPALRLGKAEVLARRRRK
ncbi:MAG: H+/Na+-translocating ferredoxin:NAD+ oxidoreductase subunit [Bacillota bacterium]|nr:H+/Na+-translocating ferredoxin:NAD+ oxidoreductase subunit [Bacillota bacterium]